MSAVTRGGFIATQIIRQQSVHDFMGTHYGIRGVCARGAVTPNPPVTFPRSPTGGKSAYSRYDCSLTTLIVVKITSTTILLLTIFLIRIKSLH